MEIPKATETIVPTIAPEDTAETTLERLEAEKAKLTEERDNYRAAYLKKAAKPEHVADESEEERIQRIVQVNIAESRLADIAKEQDELIRVALKENKELKAAQLNKREPPAAIGTHSEGAVVPDTLVTQEQLNYFKSQGWTDKDIERYKANLRRKL